MQFSEAQLAALRTSVSDGLSEYRFRHVAEVEKMTARLAALYLPEKTSLLRAAALLHDFTKEFSNEKQEEILLSRGILLIDADRLSPKLYHALTAALLIPERFPAFADPELISAVRYHTTGHAGMTVGEKILYFADYIDESRTFPECVELRHFFWDANPAGMEEEQRLAHLDDALILSLDCTVRALLDSKSPVSPDSILFYNELVSARHRRDSR